MGALSLANRPGLDEQQHEERHQEAGGGYSHHDAALELRSRALNLAPCPRTWALPALLIAPTVGPQSGPHSLVDT